jgi:uncharacterized protein (DUF302 family)
MTAVKPDVICFYYYSKKGGPAMRTICLAIISLLIVASAASADSGLVTIESAHDVKTTADRLEKALGEKGMTVFIRIDHAKGAQSVGQQLRPTEVVIFGNPKVGTPLMQCSRGAAIDLPQKALIWEDDAGKVWLSYNNPQYLVTRHKIEGCQEVVGTIEKALGNFAKAATMP